MGVGWNEPISSSKLGICQLFAILKVKEKHWTKAKQLLYWCNRNLKYRVSLALFFFFWGGGVIFCTKYNVYTEHQKKLITSSEQHTLKSKALKWIIIGQRLAIILLTKHISKFLRLRESKKNKRRINRKRSSSRAQSSVRTIASMAVT